MRANELRQEFLQFFAHRAHKVIPSAPLVPENDPTTLFISAGMQPLVPYLLGKSHPRGQRLVDVQKCLRTGDIDQVGNANHHTFFEMLGNWSLGDYFKKDSIPWSLQFLTENLELPIERLFVTVFAGDEESPRDTESAEIWQSWGIPPERIFYLGKEDNWWAAGLMGPCGPDTEIFYDVSQTPCTENCRPGDDCGRFFEIWNNVFMVYNRRVDGKLVELPTKNVDTGMGIERTLVALNGLDDSYKSDLFWPIIQTLEQLSGQTYSGSPRDFRIIADHLKAAVFLISDGVRPSNKLQGYVLRRLLRRSLVKLMKITDSTLVDSEVIVQILKSIVDIYQGVYPLDQDQILEVITGEMNRFNATLNVGLSKIERAGIIDGKIAFDLYQSYGFPLEVTKELAAERGQAINDAEFDAEFARHQQLSRTSSGGMFKGGLATSGEAETRYHTATHLLHAALRQILGNQVMQRGSNITELRLRFDFSHPQKITPEQRAEIENLVNLIINEDLPVKTETMGKEAALKSGALGFFLDKYAEVVTVYSIGRFSREICGGPHVKSTGEIGNIRISKVDSIGSGLQRIYATFA